MVALIPVALLLGLVLGWFAHRRLSLDYRARWLQSMAILEDKTLVGDGDQTALPAASAAAPPTPGGPVSREQIPYVQGKWALWEKADGSTMTYQAVRIGFDPVDLGRTNNYQRFNALYRRDREQAQEAVDALNAR
jgi:hypothetical protein